MEHICQQQKSKDQVLVDTLNQYKEMFLIARREFARITDVRGIVFPI